MTDKQSFVAPAMEYACQREIEARLITHSAYPAGSDTSAAQCRHLFATRKMARERREVEPAPEPCPAKTPQTLADFLGGLKLERWVVFCNSRVLVS